MPGLLTEERPRGRGLLDMPADSGGYGLLVAQARRKAEDAARDRFREEYLKRADQEDWARIKQRLIADMPPEKQAAEGERKTLDQAAADALGLDPTMQTRGDILPFGRDASGNMVLALPGAAVDAIKSMMLPGHAVGGGDYTPADVTRATVDWGLLSAIAPGPAGAKRMFGGVNAKSAPLADLAKAEAMKTAGEHADDIWRATGWGKGADGKWRFEIDDSAYAETRWPTMDAEPFIAEEGLSKTPYFNHEKAISAYPDLDEKVSVAFGGDKIGGMVSRDGASYANDVIDVGSQSSPSGFLHELQHAVQGREGFARGGNSKFLEETPELLRLRAEIDAAYAKKDIPLANRLLAEKVRLIETLPDPSDTYRRLAGEVEARNVQTRMDMDAGTRRQTPPTHTEDVPRDQQIVRGLLDSGPQMSVAGGPPSERVFYRGTKPGDTRRIAEPFSEAKGLTFVARKPESAQMYGDHIEQFVASPDAKILRDESPEFWKLVKRRRPPNGYVGSARGGPVEVVNDAVRAAKAAGYDAVSFSSDADIGTVILNDKAFSRKPFDPARHDSTDILASYLGIPGAGLLPSATDDDRRGLLNN